MPSYDSLIELGEDDLLNVEDHENEDLSHLIKQEYRNVSVSQLTEFKNRRRCLRNSAMFILCFGLILFSFLAFGRGGVSSNTREHGVSSNMREQDLDHVLDADDLDHVLDADVEIYSDCGGGSIDEATAKAHERILNLVKKYGGPVVVGGIGDSGTRGVFKLLEDFHVQLGSRRSEVQQPSKDSKLFMKYYKVVSGSNGQTRNIGPPIFVQQWNDGRALLKVRSAFDVQSAMVHGNSIFGQDASNSCESRR